MVVTNGKPARDMRWTVGVVTGLLTILTFAFCLGAGFKENEADHETIQNEQVSQGVRIAEEIKRSKSTDEKFTESINEIHTSQEVIKSQLKHTNQLLEKIEGKFE